MINKSTFANVLVKCAKTPMGRRMFNNFRCNFVPVFMLHRRQDEERGVFGHSPLLLEQALRFLRDHDYSVISLSDLVGYLMDGRTLPDRCVTFTMDDGFYDQLEIAVPIFKSFSSPISIFLLSEFSSGESWPWDYQVEYIINTSKRPQVNFCVNGFKVQAGLSTLIERSQLKDSVREHFKLKKTEDAIEGVRLLAEHLEVEIAITPPEKYQAISWSDAREHEDELLQFGPHSVRHAILANQSEADCRAEIVNSWQVIQDELSNPLDIFCYPTGRLNQDFGRREMGLVESLGLRAGLSVTPGYVNMNKHGDSQLRYCLPRFGFPDDIRDFIQLCSWIELIKEKLRGNL